MEIRTDYWVRTLPTSLEHEAFKMTEKALNDLLKALDKDMYIHDIERGHTFSYQDVAFAFLLLTALSEQHQLQIDMEKGE